MVIAAAEVLKRLKFGVKASRQLPISSEDAQNLMVLVLLSREKLTNHFWPCLQLFKATIVVAVQLYVVCVASYSKVGVLALPEELPAGDLNPIDCQLPPLLCS